MDVDAVNKFEASSACPICDTITNKRLLRDDQQGMWTVRCKNCGDYRIDESALADLLDHWKLEKPQYMSLIARNIRRRQRDEEAPPWVGPTWLQETCEGPLEFSSAFEQVENLVIFMAENLGPGETMLLNCGTCQAAVGAKDGQTLGWVLLQAYERRWIQGERNETLSSDFEIIDGTLTLDGWQWYNDIVRHRQSRVAFMAMKYGDEELSGMVDDYIRPAIEQTGFDLKLLSDDPEAGIIDNRLRVEIRRSRLLIADLSHHNNGAYWEAGFAEGLGLPVIYTCKKSVLDSGEVHFDTRNNLIVPWDPDSPEDAVKELKATIRNSLPDEAILEEPQ